MSSIGHDFSTLGICRLCKQITGREDEICSSVRKEHLSIVAANVARNWFTIAPRYRTKNRLASEILEALESHQFGAE